MYLPAIINTGISVKYSVLSLKARLFIDNMGIFNLTFEQGFEQIFHKKIIATLFLL